MSRHDVCLVLRVLRCKPDDARTQVVRTLEIKGRKCATPFALQLLHLLPIWFRFVDAPLRLSVEFFTPPIYVSQKLRRFRCSVSICDRKTIVFFSITRLRFCELSAAIKRFADNIKNICMKRFMHASWHLSAFTVFNIFIHSSQFAFEI